MLCRIAIARADYTINYLEELNDTIISMTLYFQACLEKNKGNPQSAWSLVNIWISTGLKPQKLQELYDKNVLKGRKVILQKYQEKLAQTPHPVLAKWTYDFFASNEDICAKPLDQSLNHNDFRRKYLMKLQAETVFR